MRFFFRLEFLLLFTTSISPFQYYTVVLLPFSQKKKTKNRQRLRTQVSQDRVAHQLKLDRTDKRTQRCFHFRFACDRTDRLQQFPNSQRRSPVVVVLCLQFDVIVVGFFLLRFWVAFVT